jgi:hypothetical protein
MFINGKLVNNFAFTSSKGTSALQLGANAGSSQFFGGYLSNIRIVKGGIPSAYVTSSTTNGTQIFTPSTAPFSISDSLTAGSVSLLTSQSNRFIDNSSNAFTVTKNGDVSVQRFSPFSPTTAYSTSVIGGSGYFDGSGDYLTELTATTALNLSSGDWSISFWVYKTATANGSIVNLYNSAGNTSGLSIWIGSGGVKVDNGVSGGVQAGTVVVNAWSYIEVIRSSGTTTIYVNGVSAGTTTQTPNASQYGSFGSAADGTLPHQGYVTDLRIVKGTALSSSVPTAPLTAITNTSLLLNYTNAGILDNAMMNDLETVGNAQISTSVKKYGTGSLAFDGTGDYLIPNSSASNLVLGLGSGDFTVEFWVYFNSGLGSDIVLYDGRPLSTNGAYPTLYVNSSSQLSYVVSSADRITSASAFSTSTWYHIALARSGTSTKMFVNGTQVGSTYTDSTNYLSASRRPTIAINGFNETAAALNGYIDDLRISKVARYTANFTAPTSAFADKGPIT